MTVLDRIPVEAITARARQFSGVDVLRLLLSLLALPFMLIGWTAKALLFALGWMWSAVLVGWESGPSRAPGKGG